MPVQPQLAQIQAVASPQEEVFMDAFSNGSLKYEPDMHHKTSVYDRLHQLVNISALVIIIAAVGIQRNKKIDIHSLFISEHQLRPAFDTLISQSMILVVFCAAMILTMWNLELLTTVSSLYMASECTIVLYLCWMA